MASYLQETVAGQIIRFITRNKVLRYPEEDPNFKIPWEHVQATEKAIEIEAGALTANADHSGADSTPETPAANEKAEPALRPAEDPERGLSTIPTHATHATHAAHATSSAVYGTTPVLTRTKTREQTQQYTAERFELEQQEAIERKTTSIITPQRTADGITLVDWYTTDDPANPQNWSSWYKVFVAIQIFLYTFGVYCTSAIYTPAQPEVMAKFGLSQAEGSLILSIYVLGYGFGPMLFSPLSELPLLGRNIPYMVSYGLFVILCVPTALADSYASLLVLRFLTGFMGSPCLATGGATMGDMYGLLKLPYALTSWVAAAFCAPALGPLLSGFSVVVKGWRWAFWEALWMNGPIFVLMFFFMPETSASNILLRRAQRLRKLTGNTRLKSQSEIDQGNATFSSIAAFQLIKPIEISLKDPAVMFVNVYTSFIYGIYYSFFEAFPITYIGIYGFNLGELGLVFLCIIVGCAIGIAVYCSYVYYYLEPDIKAHGLRAQEHRLVPALFSSMLLPAALFWFGWTAEPDIHYMVSIVGIMFFAVGAFILFQCIFMYLPLTYPQFAASLFAANDLCRSAWAAGSIIYGHPLYVNLGIGKGSSVLGGLLVGGVIGMWVLWLFGAKLRARSKFAMS